MKSYMTKKYLLWALVIVTIFFSLISSSLTTANATFHSIDKHTAFQKLKIVDGRERPEIKASVNDFKFSAQSICNENRPKHALCLDISGKGTTSADTIVASGIFVTYNKKPIDMTRGTELSQGMWLATDLQSASNTEMNFKAHASTGNVYIQLTEGESENSGQVCAYGPLIDIQKAEDAVCVDNAVVTIGSIDSKEKDISTSVTGFNFLASDICNENLSHNGVCLDIWGKGSTGANTITASGNFVTHPLESNRENSRGSWSAVELFTATEEQVSFKITSSLGNGVIKLTEGESENSGKVCVYGPLIGIQKAEDAVCVDNALVVIGT